MSPAAAAVVEESAERVDSRPGREEHLRERIRYVSLEYFMKTSMLFDSVPKASLFVVGAMAVLVDLEGGGRAVLVEGAETGGGGGGQFSYPEGGRSSEEPCNQREASAAGKKEAERKRTASLLQWILLLGRVGKGPWSG